MGSVPSDHQREDSAAGGPGELVQVGVLSQREVLRGLAEEVEEGEIFAACVAAGVLHAEEPGCAVFGRQFEAGVGFAKAGGLRGRRAD